MRMENSSTGGSQFLLDASLVRRLLMRQHPDLADKPISETANGWDNSTFRLGDQLAVRLPRREAAAGLILNEQRWLPQFKNNLPLAIPAPVRTGLPQDEYPWHWSIVPWIPGTTADLAAPDKQQAVVLAAFFNALHAAAPEEAPHNPVRGVPLVQRVESVNLRIKSLADKGVLIPKRLMDCWYDAVAAPVDVGPTWIHGDLHPRNILIQEGQIQAIIDWGDVAQGDRATDLAAIWMLFSCPESRALAIAACNHVSAITWVRARGWALLFAVVFMDAVLPGTTSMAAIGEQIVKNLMEDLPAHGSAMA